MDGDRQQVGLGHPKNGRQSPFTRIRSPPRSPRRTSLLLALKDVIGDAAEDEEEGSEEEDEEGNEQPVASTSGTLNFYRESATSNSTSISTVKPAPIDISFSTSHPSPENSPQLQDDELGHLSTFPDGEIANLRRLSRASHVSQLSTLSALSSSLGLSQFPVPPSYTSFSDGKDDDEEEGDSGFYDSTRPQLRNLPESLTLSPPRTTFNLLASPFGSPSSRVNPNGLMSPGLMSPRDRSPVGPYVPRSPFSGTFSLSHAASNDPSSVGQIAGYGADCEPEGEATDDGNVSVESLDSPTVYYQQKEKEAQRESVFSDFDVGLNDSIGSLEILKRPDSESVSLEGSFSLLKRRDSMRRSPLSVQIPEPSENDSEEDTPRSVFEDDDDDDYRFDGDEEMEDEDDEDEEEDRDEDEEVEDATEPTGSGHTSFWDTQDTIVYTGQRQSRSQPSSETVEFLDDEVQGCSSFRGRTDSVATTELDLQPISGTALGDLDEEGDAEEETARLAYLITDRENDTLNSLIDVYSDISEEDEAANDIADRTERDLTPNDPDEVDCLESGIPLPSPTPSEVHAYALLDLFEKNKREQRRISPGDAWAYEPDESFSTSSSVSRTAAMAALAAAMTGGSSQKGNDSYEQDRSFGSVRSASDQLISNMSVVSAAAMSALAAAMTSSTSEVSEKAISASSPVDIRPRAESQSHEVLAPSPLLKERVFTPPPSSFSQSSKVEIESQGHPSPSPLLKERVFTPPPPSLYSQSPKVEAESQESVSPPPKERMFTPPPLSSHSQSPRSEVASREISMHSQPRNENATSFTPLSSHSQLLRMDDSPKPSYSPTEEDGAASPPRSLHLQSPTTRDASQEASTPILTSPSLASHSQSPRLNDSSIPSPPRERVFTPPLTSSQPERPVIPQERLSISQLEHRTPPQQSQSSRPRTPRSAPAATAVYEKDKKRTSTMIEPLPMLSLEAGCEEDEVDSVDEEVSNSDGDDSVEDTTADQEEQTEEIVPSTSKGLRPLRLSTLLLTNTKPSPTFTPSTADTSHSHFGHGDDAGRQSSGDLETNTNDISRSRLSISSLSLSTANAPASSVPPTASTPASAISDSHMFSLFNTSSSSHSTHRPSPRPSWIPMPDSDSTPRPSSSLGLVSSQSKSILSSVPSSPTRSSSCAPLSLPQRRQSRIHYIRSDVPQSAPPVGSNNSATASSYRSSMRSSRRNEPDMEDSTFVLPHSRLSHLRSRTVKPLGESASTQEEYEEEDSIRQPIASPRHPTPTPIHIPAPSRASSLSIQSGAESPFSAQVRTRSSRTSPLAEVEKDRPAALVPEPPATPCPTLLFAIASDDAVEVQKVLEASQPTTAIPSSAASNAGKASAGCVTANDAIGPQSQSALENKLDIVKVLLGYGADPQKSGLDFAEGASGSKETALDGIKSKLADLDDATRYYLSRACSNVTRKTAALMKRSAFRPLERMRYGIIGQDRALEQLFRVLSMHSGTISKTSQPIVDQVDTAKVCWLINDTVPCTLVEFLANNEGKRCVVVLDEIEKTEDAKALWSLLVPWELGRCTFEANSRTIDVRNVIWVGTSNIGQDIILSYHEARERKNEMMTREEYVELMGIVRPRLSDQLGASVLSRVSASLPFVPFTDQERRAIASEFISQSEKESELVKEMVLSKEKSDEKRWREQIIKGAMSDFILSEGARSLYRAVSSQLVDSLDDL
ncbi:hypothetical protein VNI00_012149 [Paramarasmius palmivorus]|uniref:Uncharacterized protein n=1 Tax=Paramarasmius palmivorus TaxID=297713 RepID=A0AAW0C8V6_9AGAR